MIVVSSRLSRSRVSDLRNSRSWEFLVTLSGENEDHRQWDKSSRRSGVTEQVIKDKKRGTQCAIIPDRKGDTILDANTVRGRSWGSGSCRSDPLIDAGNSDMRDEGGVV